MSTLSTMPLKIRLGVEMIRLGIAKFPPNRKKFPPNRILTSLRRNWKRYFDRFTNGTLT